jgi:hypothetical protein
LERYNKDGKEIFKIVLSLNKISENKVSNGFINITYKELVKKIEENQGYYINYSNTEYLKYFLDLIKTIKNLYGSKLMNKEMIEFLKDNWEIVCELQKEVEKLNKIKYKRVENIKSLLNINTISNIKNWVYSKKCVVTDIYLTEKIILAMDFYLELKEPYFKIFIRNKKLVKNPEILEDILRENNTFDFEITGDKIFYLKNLEVVNYGDSDNKLAEIIENLTEILCNNTEKFLFY